MKKLALFAVLALVAAVFAVMVIKKRKEKQEVVSIVFNPTDPTNPAFQQLRKVIDYMENVGFTEEERPEFTKLVSQIPEIHALFEKYLDRRVLKRHAIDFIAFSHRSQWDDDTPEEKAYIKECANQVTSTLVSKRYGSVCFEGLNSSAQLADIEKHWEDIKGIPAGSFGGELGDFGLIQLRFIHTLRTNKPALKQAGLLEKFLDVEDALSQVRSYIALAHAISRLEKNPRETLAICYGARHIDDLERIAKWSGLRYSIIDIGMSHENFKQIKATYPREKWF